MTINIRLTVDYAFKRVFGHTKNTKILISFLNDVMSLSGNDKIVSVKIKNPFSTKDFKADKQNILDIKAEDNLGRLYDVEVQVAVYKSYPKRILHYACNMYADQINAGTSYSKLKPVISINIMDNVLFDDCKRFTNRFTLKNTENDLILTEDLCFYIFELPKFDISENNLSEPLEEWLYLIKSVHKIDPNNPPDLKHIPIKDILEELKKMNKTKLEKQQYEDRIKAQRDLLSIQEDSYNKGREEEKYDTAKKMLDDNIEISMIQKYTGLSKEEIEELL